VATAALALLVVFVPRKRDLRQTAALGAALVIGVELGITHWFYLYVVWFVPFVLVGLFAADQRVERDQPIAAAREESRPATAVPA
jgi:hypothetical protein